jgi:hypothetical protein
MNRLLAPSPGPEALRAGGSVPHRERHPILVVSAAIHEISGLEVGLIKLQIVLSRNEVLMWWCCLVIRPVHLASCSKTLWYLEAALQ